MNIKKPKFWDKEKPNIIAYFLLPLSLITLIFNVFKNLTKKKYKKIKTICVGNIYLGGTGKTPISIQLNKILKDLKFKTCFIKKNYNDQIDEQKILANHGKLYCDNERINSVNKAINESIDIAIFDDGLQDNTLSYDITFVCFNIQNWKGNGLLLPAGPLRESLKNLKKYDAIFLNGNGENPDEIKDAIKSYNPNLKIFETSYEPVNLSITNNKFNYLAFAGIGNPKTFQKTLKNNNINIIKFLEFPDHYNYTDNDIIKIKHMAKELNAKILTTEKDYMRLNKLNSEGLEFFKVELSIKNEKDLINFLKNKL